jgi:hypothetical protein
MIVNIEKEYCDSISNDWEKFADLSRDILKPHNDQQHAYDAISKHSIKFLQDKLKSLESKET